MTYYADLTPYEYSYADSYARGHNVLNVGWLDVSRSYPTAHLPVEFEEKLLEFCFEDYIVQNTAGWHTCNLGGCPGDHPPEKRGDNIVNLGRGEIRVIGKACIYAAPTLIYHYVKVHHYSPPEEFIEAVFSYPAHGSDEFADFIKKYEPLIRAWLKEWFKN
jgi:hypothetical protein